MNKVIIDKGSIPPYEEKEDDHNDIPPFVLIKYDLASHHYQLSHRGSKGISKDTRRQRRLPLSG